MEYTFGAQTKQKKNPSQLEIHKRAQSIDKNTDSGKISIDSKLEKRATQIHSFHFFCCFQNRN